MLRVMRARLGLRSFCLVQEQLGLFYSVTQGFFEALIIAKLLLYWLMYMHSLSACTFANLTPE